VDDNGLNEVTRRFSGVIEQFLTYLDIVVPRCTGSDQRVVSKARHSMS
jgi:hypothetical protein